MWHRHAKRLWQFALIGGGVFIIGQLLLVMFVELLLIMPLVANVIQLAITLVLSYLLNAAITWRDRSPTNGTKLRFALSRILTALTAYLLFSMLVVFGNVHYLAANMIGTTVGMLANYILGDQWVFRGNDAPGRHKATRATPA